MQEEVLCQVRGTRLFKLVRDLLSDPCCNYTESTSPKVSTLPEIVATACCQGAAVLTGNPHVMDQNISCCKATCKSVQSNGDATIVSGTVVISGGNEQGVDILVPVSGKPGCCGSVPGSCIARYPTSCDILTVLLLALPPSTWSAVRDHKVLNELQDLVSMESLPELLQLEVWPPLPFSLETQIISVNTQ
jgi:glutathione gamma-glutamylcysteinyltransferase